MNLDSIEMGWDVFKREGANAIGTYRIAILLPNGIYWVNRGEPIQQNRADICAGRRGLTKITIKTQFAPPHPLMVSNLIYPG